MNIDDILNSADTDSDEDVVPVDIETLLDESSDDEQHDFKPKNKLLLSDFASRQTIESLLSREEADESDVSSGMVLESRDISWKLSTQHRDGKDASALSESGAQLFSTEKMPISLESAYRHELLSQSAPHRKCSSLIMDSAATTFGLRSSGLKELSSQLSKNAQVLFFTCSFLPIFLPSTLPLDIHFLAILLPFFLL
jgi:hypothetical protein